MAEPQELARLVAEFGKAYKRRIWAEIERAGTTPSRARLLMVLQYQGECKMNQVSSWLEVTPRNVTKLVDALEAEGLVTREAHPHDRRATVLRLTPAGRQVCQESARADHCAAARVYECLTPDERRQMASIIGKLLEALREECAGAPGGGEG
jgi:DNA-binding MarR family transcriptional regulator